MGRGLGACLVCGVDRDHDARSVPSRTPRDLGAGAVTGASIARKAAALLGSSTATHCWMLRLCGFLADRVGDRVLIRGGVLLHERSCAVRAAACCHEIA